MTLREILDALNAAVRDAYSNGGRKYCWVDDADAETGICWAWIEEKTYQISYSIDAEGKVKLGDKQEVRRTTKYVPVFNFSATDLTEIVKAAPASVFGKDFPMVARRGLLFEAGDYPDKGVSFDPQDLFRAAELFAPVQNDIEHQPSILDGMLGGIESVEATEDGKLFGVVTIPAWLDELYEGEPLKVSLAWNRDKRIVGNGLVLNPRIKDANIVTAFSAARSLRSEPPADAPKRTKMPTIKEIWKQLTGQDPKSLDDPVAFADPSGGEGGSPAPTTLAVQAGQIVMSQADYDALKAKADQAGTFAASQQTANEAALTTEATSFADGLIKAGRLNPTFKDGTVATYKSVALSGSGNEYKFSADGKFDGGDALKNYRATLESLPVNPAFAAEQVDGGGSGSESGLHVLFGNGEKVTDSRVKDLLGKSKLGKAAMAAGGK